MSPAARSAAGGRRRKRQEAEPQPAAGCSAEVARRGFPGLDGRPGEAGADAARGERCRGWAPESRRRRSGTPRTGVATGSRRRGPPFRPRRRPGRRRLGGRMPSGGLLPAAPLSRRMRPAAARMSSIALSGSGAGTRRMLRRRAATRGRGARRCRMRKRPLTSPPRIPASVGSRHSSQRERRTHGLRSDCSAALHLSTFRLSR